MIPFSSAGASNSEFLPLFVVGLVLLSLLPFLLTMLTSFAKLVIVGGLIRQAVGTPQIPPTVVITGLALVLTIHIMAPVALKVSEQWPASRAVVLKESLTAPFREEEASKEADRTLKRAVEEGSDEPRRTELEAKKLAAKSVSDRSKQARISITNAANAAGVGTQHESWGDSECARIFDKLQEVRAKARQSKASAKSPVEAGVTAEDDGAITEQVLLLQAAAMSVRGPLRDFLTQHAAPRHIPLFEGLQAKLRASRGVPADLFPLVRGSWAHDLLVMAPAFVLTELSEAFLIGFLIFVPFLVIDLVVSNVLLALGMQMLTPTMISLPLKLLLFVLMDGWNLILQGLVLSYA